MSKQITARVTDQFHQDFFKIGIENGLNTTKEILEHIFTTYKNIENPVNTDNSEKITQLENLTETLKHEISELETALNQKQAEPEIKEITKEIPAKLKENQILVDTNFKEFFALEVTQSAIFEAKGAKKTKADILRNLFIQYFSEGVGDWLPISDKHRRNWVNMIKTETEKQQK